MSKDKEKLKKILEGISQAKDTETTKVFRRVALKLKKAEMAKQGIDEVKNQIQSIFEYIADLKQELKKSENEKVSQLRLMMDEYRSASLEKMGILSAEMDTLKEDIKEISQRKVEIPNLESQIKGVKDELEKITSNSDLDDTKKKVAELEEEIKKLRRDAMVAIANKGGGNMNRNILVGNNPSTLGRYTDLNIRAGTNITLSYQNNDNLKTTDLTIAATGGGAGITRNINTVIVSSVIGAVASTDYVIVAGEGIQLTLPTAVGNLNLYTIKNKFASSVMVVADGVETIDGDANIILATQYTAVDLISDNANWHIT